MLLFSSSVAPARTTDYSNVWGHFAVLVWQYNTPPPGQLAERAYDALNLAGIHLDDGFSQELYQFARSRDYEYYVDHAAGKGDLHLYRREWEPFHEAYKRNRNQPVRPRVLLDPALRERLFNRLRENIPRAKDGLCLAYAFDDEISTTSFTSPVDLCWAPESLAAFRRWLERRYGSLDALNAEWATHYTRFDDALPLTVDDVRDAWTKPFSQWNLSRWADHREFMDDVLAELLTALRDEANRLDDQRPAGFVGGQAPSAYGGYDYAKLSRAVQWMEAYDIGGTDALLRSFWGTRKPRAQTFFATGKLHVDRWFLWNALVRGNRGVIAWPELNGKSWFQGEGILPEIQRLAPTFDEIQGILGEMLVGAEPVTDGIGIYYSQPSIRVSWMMDAQVHGSTWVNRSSSLNNANASDILNRVAWIKWLEDCGFGYEFVSYLDVQEGVVDLSRYRALILPRAFALSEREIEALTAYVHNGGLLIADYGTALFDEHGKGRMRGGLDSLFGIARGASGAVLNGETIAEVNAEKDRLPLRERVSYDRARRVGDFVLYERVLRGISGTKIRNRNAGADFVVENTSQKGRTIYLNATPIPYLWLRREPGGMAYRDLLRSLLASAQVFPRVEIERTSSPSPTIARLWWRKDNTFYLCLVENPVRDALVDGMGDVEGIPTTDSERLRLRFSAPLRELFDERSNRSFGSGNVFEMTWNPQEAAILRVEYAPSRTPFTRERLQ